MSPLPRVVVLGGGVGAVTAAYQLSKPGWQQHYASITVYQQGWRLGGKGASGRGVNSRIEEHGLHIWFGFYENAFRLLRECHEELDALAAATKVPRWPLPFASVQDSFQPCTEISLTDHDGCCWSSWTADFFAFDEDRPWADPDPRMPGERPEDWSVAFYAARCLHLAADLAGSLLRSGGPATAGASAVPTAMMDAEGFLEARLREVWTLLGGDVQQLLSAAAQSLDALVAAGVSNSGVLKVVSPVLRALDVALEVLRREAEGLIRADDTARRAWYVVDVMLAIVRGLIDDEVIHANSFALVDDVEFSSWLRAHGADAESASCALVRGVVYDLAFAYENGDPHRPAAAAGTALRGLLRTFFTYRGALMFKMRSGMGDTIFAPYYELLAKRGVQVEFFHRVEEIRAQNGAIEEIEIDVQARIAKGTTAEGYLAPPKGPGTQSLKPVAVWPAAPTVPILSSAGKTAVGAPATAATYESWFAPRSATQVSTLVLKRGAAVDGFDIVVSGLPIACVPHVAPELVAQSQRWADAVAKVKTVPTQALQLWLDRSAVELGAAAEGMVVGGYVEPYDTWADMSHLIDQEDLPLTRSIAYFCNVLLDSPPPPRGQAAQWLAEQDALVRAQAVRFLTHDIAQLWPDGVDPLTGELDWARLVADPGLVGQARLDAQYLRANVEPSERYVLSVPGSGVHRIQPGDTGFANLYVAGDWTACTLDAGCVEAATISGMLAANAIHLAHGNPAAVEPIVGAEHP